jgi:nitrogen fixation protein FixH
MISFSHPSDAKRGGLKGTHVLFSLLLFFAVIVGADATLIYKAVTTFGGVDNVNAYRDGLAYNARIAADVQQTGLGWQDQMEISGDPARLRLSLKAGDGAPIGGKTVAAEVGRPATNRFDRAIALIEVTPGSYEAVLEGAESGTWLVEVQVFSGQESGSPMFQARRRLWVGH